MKRTFYAQQFTGLNNRSAPHLIDHSDFQVAENVSYEEIGAAAPLPNDRLLWESGTGKQGIYSLRYGGSDHLLVAADDVVYEDGSVISGLSVTGGTPSLISDGDKVFVLDGVENQVYDGTRVRTHGAPDVPESDTVYALAIVNDGLDVAATASASPTEFTTITDHNLSDGDIVQFYGMTGGTWSEMNGLRLEITVTADNKFTVAYDTSGLGSLTGGTIAPVSVVAGMSYRYAVSTVVEIEGKEIESSLVDLWVYHGGFGYGSPDKDPVNITDGQVVYVSTKLQADPLAGYVSPATGCSFKMVVYRTKGNGDTFYRLREVESSEMSAGYQFSFLDSVADPDLGAAWLYDEDANNRPPIGTMAVICQYRMFVAGVANNTTRLYFSGIGRYDYFGPTDFIECRDTITALAEMGDRVAVFSDSGIGVYIPDDTVGQYKRSLSPVGVENKEAVVSTNIGVMFARSDGLWLFDGNTSQLINEPATGKWPAGPWQVAYIPNRLVATTGSESYIMDIGGGKMRWSEVDGDCPAYVTGAHDGSALYGVFDSGEVRELFTTYTRVMRVRTRDWGGGGSWRAMWAIVDGTAEYDFTIRVISSSGDTHEAEVEKQSGRWRYRISVPRSIRGDYISIEVEGRVSVYQIELAVG